MHRDLDPVAGHSVDSLALALVAVCGRCVSAARLSSGSSVWLTRRLGNGNSVAVVMTSGYAHAIGDRWCRGPIGGGGAVMASGYAKAVGDRWSCGPIGGGRAVMTSGYARAVGDRWCLQSMGDGDGADGHFLCM